MTRKSSARLTRDGVIPEPKPKRNFTPQEAMELQEMNRIVNAKKWEADLIKNNTALVPSGQEVAETFMAIARLCENEKNRWVASKLTQCGYENGAKVNINLITGQITEQHEPADDSKAQ